jgi:hypothetical protein
MDGVQLDEEVRPAGMACFERHAVITVSNRSRSL